MSRNNTLAVIAGLALVILLPLGLLYAYRSQTPAVPTVPYGAVVAEIEQGRVRSIDIAGQRATITLIDATQQQTTIPDQDSLRRALDDHNRSNPTRQIDSRYGNDTPWVGPFLVTAFVSLLPLLLIVALVLLAASAFWRARAPQRYEALSRLADLRDRGVINEEEFQREKRHILR
jgi:ATP-dependent Zn protease